MRVYIVVAVVLVSVFLAFAFIYADPDPTHWSITGRIMAVIIAAAWAASSAHDVEVDNVQDDE